MVRDGPDGDFAATARRVLGFALPGTSRLGALRATASSLLGSVATLDGAGVGKALHEDAALTLVRTAARLRAAFAPVVANADWPWPEPVLTYENALLPQALIVAGARLADADLRRMGLLVLDWLIGVQTTDAGRFAPIGNRGFWRHGGPRGRFDQQPIEATSMILACEVAFAQTADRRYLRAIEAAYGWFLGDNDVGVAVADAARGGCYDGLEPLGVNLNQGAESTLMWLTAVEHVREVRHHAGPRQCVPTEPVTGHLIAT